MAQVALGVVQTVPLLIGASTEILSSLETFSNRSLSAFDDAISKYKSLKSKEVDSEINAGDLRCSLKRASEATYVYVDRIDDVFWYGHNAERIKRVKEGIEKGDFRELIDYLWQLKGSLDKCAESHQEAEEALEEVRLDSTRAAGDCRKMAQEARTKKNLTRGVGGTAAAGALAAGVAGGVAASVVAGVFTFGIGTVVGLGLTAAGSVAAGTGIATATGVATHLIADGFEEAEKDFKWLNRSFNDLASEASTMLDTVCTLKMYLESVSSSRQNLEGTMETYRLRSSVTTALDRLCYSLGESYKRSSTYRERMKAKNEEVQESI